ncbi:cytochrome b [Simiduia sp. 21SJ11W-1]|uniref:cytochrome b n=1 Tax=Simiduia sp. 21SJ11W-1 TaxID=2909669 RepID=UPI00209EB24D|nr:cytochrome b [Simiduia sp. 21SJ11W-1]UTA49356.1 cytochrome b [Simiduia sp. 21SJ11W-1]
MNTERYHLVSRSLHWLMALMIFGLIAVGNYMSGLDRDAPGRVDLILLHKATGFVFIWLLIARIAWAFKKPAPKLPEAFSKTERVLAKSTKHLLYLLMAIVPLSGWAMANFAGSAIKFGGVSVPLLFEENRALAGFFHEVHEYAPWVLLAVVVLHLTAVLYHLFEGEKKSILSRML